MSNSVLFTEINSSEEATVSGGCGGYYSPFGRGGGAMAIANTSAASGLGSANATADASASGGNVFTNTFTFSRVDRFGNSYAVSRSFSRAFSRR